MGPKGPDTAFLYHYVIVRADLPHGVQIAQTIHAAGESSPGKLPPNTHAVALHSSDESELLDLEQLLSYEGISFVAIREPDQNNELMAIGIVPQIRTKHLRKLLSRFSLVKGDR